MYVAPQTKPQIACAAGDNGDGLPNCHFWLTNTYKKRISFHFLLTVREIGRLQWRKDGNPQKDTFCGLTAVSFGPWTCLALRQNPLGGTHLALAGTPGGFQDS